MRILAVVKRVPDSRATIRVAGDGSGIDMVGLKFVCDPFDEFGVEQAVQLKERRSDVQEVAALAAGPGPVAEVLQFAVAMGADRAIHVLDDGFPLYDELYIAAVLAMAIRADPRGFDLILCGKQNIDNDAGELGPALAEHLGLPHVGAVTRLEVADDASWLTAHRRIEGAEEVVTLALPALLTCEKGLVQPRFPALPKLLKAKKTPIETRSRADLPGCERLRPATTLTSLAPPLPRAPCRFLEGEPGAAARQLVRLLREEARVI